MERTQRTDEMERVAAMAAAEVVRIMGPAATQAADVRADEGMRKDIEFIKNSVEKIEKKLETHYVSVEQFEPVRRIVYFVVGVFGLGVISAIVALVVKR